MVNVYLRRAAPWACAWMLGLPAYAGEAVPPGQVVPAPFKHYRGWQEEPLQDWRAANDRVGEVGGWRAYLRESQQDGGTGTGGHGDHSHQGH